MLDRAAAAPTVPQGLAAAGYAVSQVVAYRPRAVPQPVEVAERSARINREQGGDQRIELDPPARRLPVGGEQSLEYGPLRFVGDVFVQLKRSFCITR